MVSAGWRRSQREVPTVPKLIASFGGVKESNRPFRTFLPTVRKLRESSWTASTSFYRSSLYTSPNPEQHRTMNSTPQTTSVPSLRQLPMKSVKTLNREGLRQRVHEAVSALPEDTTAYFTACSECPHLVRTESDPARFAELESGNILAAAARLVTYWQMRVRMFGERAFRKLDDLSGEGALDAKDIDTLKTGYLALLPNDPQGRPAVFFNNSKADSPFLDGRESGPSKSRCLFYMLNALAQEGSSAVIMRYSATPKWEKARAFQVMRLIRAMPMQFDAFCYLFRPPPGAARLFRQGILPVVQEFGKYNLEGKGQFCVGESAAELREFLQKLGLEAKSLPAELGGTWTPEQFQQWLQLRLPRDKSQDLSALSQAAEEALLQERRERKRKFDVQYARERRKREKKEAEGLQDKSLALSKENLKLRDEEQRLVQLLEKAKARVAEHTARGQATVARPLSPPAMLPATTMPVTASRPSTVMPSRAAVAVATSDPGNSAVEALQLMLQMEGRKRKLESRGLANSIASEAPPDPLVDLVHQLRAKLAEEQRKTELQGLLIRALQPSRPPTTTDLLSHLLQQQGQPSIEKMLVELLRPAPQAPSAWLLEQLLHQRHAQPQESAQLLQQQLSAPAPPVPGPSPLIQALLGKR